MTEQSILHNLLQQPITWLTITLGAYLLGQKIYLHLNNASWLPPVLSGFVLVMLALWATQTPYAVYSEGGELLSFFLGPVVVGLSVPLFHHLHSMKRQMLIMTLALSLGSLITVATAMALTHYWVGIDIITNTMASKSVTTPVAVAITEQTQGIPALAAAFVMVTGIMGAAIIPPLLKLVKLDTPQATGTALGTCAHAVGTSRAIELSQEHAAYAAMAMTLTASLHALIIPWII